MSSPDVVYQVKRLLEGIKSTTGYYGWQDVVANTDSILDDFFAQRGLETGELAQIKTAYAVADRVSFDLDYPYEIEQLPHIFIIHTGDEPSPQTPMGRQLGPDHTLDDDTNVYLVTGIKRMETVMIGMAAADPESRNDIYLIVRELLWRMVPGLIAKNIIEPQFFGGRTGGFNMTNVHDGTPIRVSAAEIYMRCHTRVCATDDQQLVTGIISSEMYDGEGQVELEVSQFNEPT